MVSKYQLTIFGLALITTSCCGELLCYNCGVKEDGSDLCEMHPTKSSSANIVKCPPNTFCSKTLSRQNNGELKMEATRGCASQVTISGKQHSLGCSTDQRTGAYVCHCDSHLCNKGHLTECQLNVMYLTIAIFVLIKYLIHHF